MEPDVAEYCRQIETYLCQKNDGHLIRVVGPSFDLVCGWAQSGVPLKVACRGIDRYFERYYSRGLRRRPVRIDFCEADVLDAFDEWRRATGLIQGDPESSTPGQGIRRGPSLADHLQRVLLRLTNARAQNELGPSADQLIDRVSAELDVVRTAPRGLRGDARARLIERLAALDVELLNLVRESLDVENRAALSALASDQLSGFRDQMAEETYARAHARTLDGLIRERFNLPTIALA